MKIKPVPHELAQLYFDFTCLALRGQMQEADQLMIHRGRQIRQAAQLIMHNVLEQHEPEPVIYRGLMLKWPNLKKLRADHRTFLSFSESPDIAREFATSFGLDDDLIRTPQGLMTMRDWTKQNLGEHGYLIEHRPDYRAEVLWHWRLTTVLPHSQAVGSEGLATLIRQREVTIDPQGRTFKLQRVV